MINRRIIINLIVFFSLSTALILYGAVTLFGNPVQVWRALGT